MHTSFEIFPPKKEGSFEAAFEIVKRLAEREPDFISVTYGAGGSKSKKTLDIASYVQNECHTKAVAHLTCVGSKKEEILKRCSEFEEKNISCVLALRGDRPEDMNDETYFNREFFYATDLIQFIKEHSSLKVMAACYPEKHYEAKSMEEDLQYMKAKQDLGVEGFISQMFFDNQCFYNYMNLLEKKQIIAPVHAGIMPITAAKQLGTSVSLSGSSVPEKLTQIIEKYGETPEDMYKAGIDYAIEQILDLKTQGVDGIHIYTMNKPDVALSILQGIS